MADKTLAKSRTRLLSLLLFFLCVALGAWVLLDWLLVGRAIHVSKATTFVDGPLDSQGNVDFGAALNQFISQDVTPNNNAIVDLVRALGPGALPNESAGEFFAQLGIAPVSPNGTYFVDLEEYATKSGVTSFNETQVFSGILERPWSPSEYPVARQWLEANTQAIEAYRTAASRTHLYNPVVLSNAGLLMESPLPLIDRSRDLTRLMTANSLLQMDAGNWEAATRDIQAIRDLGVLLTRRGNLVQWQVGYTFILKYFDLQLALCRHVCAVDPDQLPAIAASFRDWSPPEDLLAWPAAVKRFELLDATAAIAQRRPHLWNNERLAALSRGGLYVIDPNAAMANCNRWLDQQYAALFTADRIQRDDQLVKFEAELNRQADQYNLPGNALISRLTRTGRAKLVTDVMLSFMMPAWRAIADAESRIVQVSDLSKIMFALELFRLQNGKYPSQLSELNPEFIAVIPDDRYSGKPLMYRPDDNGFILYSLGGNRLDNAGADYPSDVTLRMTRAN